MQNYLLFFYTFVGMAGVYIHIPFCKKKCIYCDFYSVALSQDYVAKYLSALKKEFVYRKSEIGEEKIKTIYIGGGTPSMLSTQQLGDLVHTLDCSNTEERTVEVNPDDLTSDYVRGLVEAGFNRVSMGVQSFNDEELKFLRRRHGSEKAVEAVRMLQDAGIDNISIDLIYGIPGQTKETWSNSLRVASSLGVKHISAYSLMYEEGTRLTLMRDRGDFEEISDDVCVEMYQMLVADLSKMGFVHYEISNFALPGYESKHNSSYWDFTPYIGLGASAHSFDGKVRRYNPSSVKNYIEAVSERSYAYEEESETALELYNEWIMTRLRTKKGMDMDDLKVRFPDFCDYAEKVVSGFIGDGLMQCSGAVVSLTDRGVMLSDMIFRDLFLIE